MSNNDLQIKNLRQQVERQQGKRTLVEDSIKRLRTEAKLKGRELRQHEQAREVIRTVGIETQKQLQYHISDITSLALESVFNDPYKLEVEFVQRRNKTECDIHFVRDGQRVDPLTASGGGAVDVAAFALRIASWSMETPKSRNLIILDEPMRFVSHHYQEKASMMIKEVSKKLGLQFIIITHEPVLAAHADKVFETEIKNGVTNIK